MAPPKPGNAFAQQKEMERLQKIMTRRIAQQRKASEAAAEAARKTELENQQATSQSTSSSTSKQQKSSSDSTSHSREDIQFVFAPPRPNNDYPPTPQTAWNFEYSPTILNSNEATLEAAGNVTNSLKNEDKSKDKSKYTSTESSTSAARPNALFYRDSKRNKQSSNNRWECRTDVTKRSTDADRNASIKTASSHDKQASNATTYATTPQSSHINDQLMLPSPDTPLAKTTYKAPDYGRVPLPLNVVSQHSHNHQPQASQQTFTHHPPAQPTQTLTRRPKQPIDWHAHSHLYGITPNSHDSAAPPPTHTQITHRQRMPTHLSASTFATNESQYLVPPSTNSAIIYGNSSILPTLSDNYAYPTQPKKIRPQTAISMVAQFDTATLKSPTSESSQHSPGMRRSLSDSYLLHSPPCTARISHVGESAGAYVTVEQVGEKIDLLLRLQALERSRVEQLMGKVDELLARKSCQCECKIKERKASKDDDEVIFERGDIGTEWYRRGGARME